MQNLSTLLLVGTLSILACQSTQANTKCFVVTEDAHAIIQEGSCTERRPPNSTFKIALSLMGFNEKILIDATHPTWPYEEGYPHTIEAWKQPHNPSMWMQNSCVWFSQVLTQKMGKEKFDHYVKAFDYGNQDTAGEPGKNNGLTHAWLSSSLKISPLEKIAFLKKLLASALPVSKEAHVHTRNILYMETLASGWKLYGKTGTGHPVFSNEKKDETRDIGWFIGWIEKDNRTIPFVHHIERAHTDDSWAGRVAKEEARKKLIELIEKGSV